MSRPELLWMVERMCCVRFGSRFTCAATTNRLPKVFCPQSNHGMGGEGRCTAVAGTGKEQGLSPTQMQRQSMPKPKQGV